MKSGSHAAKPVVAGPAKVSAALEKEPLQVRIPSDVKRRFKAAAAMRGLEPHELFVEVWREYEACHKPEATS